jgi:hypothetical protein
MIDGNIKLKPIYRRFWAARFSCTLQKAIAYAIVRPINLGIHK